MSLCQEVRLRRLEAKMQDLDVTVRQGFHGLQRTMLSQRAGNREGGLGIAAGQQQAVDPAFGEPNEEHQRSL